MSTRDIMLWHYEAKPQVIDVVELVKRIHNKLAQRILNATALNQLLIADVFNKADDIVIQELKTMTEEATQKILGRKRIE